MRAQWFPSIAAVAAAVLLTVPVSAQTNDHNWRSWTWLEDLGAPRAAGMGGAFVAVADDNSAVITNPAGMATLKRTEVGGAVMGRASGTLAGSDTTASRTGVGYVGGVVRISEKWAGGFFLAEPHDERLTVAGAGDTGYLQTTVTDAGAAIAWHPRARFYAGLRLNATHLRLQGLLDHAEGSLGYESGTASSQTRLGGDGGILLVVSEGVTLGATFRQGARWDASRTGYLFGSQAAIPPVEYQVASPSRLAAGIAWRPSRKLLLAAEGDYVLLGRLRHALDIVIGPFAAGDYELRNALEARGGAEVSVPAGSVSLQFRGGVVSRPASALRYTGESTAEAAAFPGEGRRTLGTLGASLVARRVRLDVAGVFGDVRSVVTAGAAVTF